MPPLIKRQDRCPFCGSRDLSGKTTSLSGWKIAVCASCACGFDVVMRNGTYEEAVTFLISEEKLLQYRRNARRLMPLMNTVIETCLIHDAEMPEDILEIGPGYGLTADYLTTKVTIGRY